MKKYGKIIAFSLVIVISFALFSIDTRSITKDYPKFTINHVAGDETEVEQIKVVGNSNYGMGYSSEVFEIDLTGTTYLRDQEDFRFPNIYGYYYSEPQVVKLQEKYRDFMRGKSLDRSNFYEGEKAVAYVNIPYGFTGMHNEFSVSYFDKKANKSTSFKVPIPNRKDYQFIHVEKVIALENEIFIFSHNTFNLSVSNSENHNSTINLYKINVDKQTITKEKQFSRQLNNEDSYYDDLFISYSADAKGNEVIVSSDKTYFLYDNEANIFDEERFAKYKGVIQDELIITDKVITYNLQTGEERELFLDELKGLLFGYQDNLGYFAEVTSDAIMIHKINLVNGETVASIRLANNGEYLDIYEFKYMPIINGKLYLSETYVDFDENEGVGLYVLDLERFEIVYEGEIATEFPNGVYEEWFYYHLTSIEEK